MSVASEPKRCPNCGGPIPAEAPEGLCPKCLLMEVSVPTEAGKGAAVKSTPPAWEELAAAFPKLEILELIGQGGMGYVFKARQPKIDRLVALKILPQSLAADPAFAERFTREGRLLARLNHPNIVTLYDFGQANGLFYLLMEFVDGVNLRQAMKAGRFTPGQALAVVPKICEALQYAHNEGILHRDIKPENILLDTKGRVKIADFGIAKLVVETRAEAKPAASSEPPAEASLTTSGATLGTPNYMAPEQIAKPSEVDHRADIYSLGVVFYEMLTGELPVGRFAPPSEKSSMDPRLDDVVLRALAKEPARRTQSAGEVKTQIETITRRVAEAGTPARGHRRAQLHKTLVVVATVAFLLGLIRVFFVQPMVAETNAAAPEIPRGSHFLVWKLASNFKPGDVIAYQDGRRKLLGRIISADSDTVAVHRNNDAPDIVPRKRIIGRVIGNTRASAPQVVVGSLRLIVASGYKNIAIARAESIAGYPLHQVIVRFTGPEISEEQQARARTSITGPLLVTSRQQRISGAGPGPVDSTWLGTNSPSWASAISYECPGPCQLQFVLPDDETARDAAHQIEKALAGSARLAPGESIKLFVVGEREAWLEVRRFQPLTDKFAFFRHPGLSPARIPGTNRIEGVVATIPPDYELGITGNFVSNGVIQAEHVFSATLASGSDQPGLYWFTWYSLPNPQSMDDGPKESWELCIHDATTGRELHRFHAPQSSRIGWRRRGWYDDEARLFAGEPLRTVIFESTLGSARALAGQRPPPFVLLEMVMRPRAGKAQGRDTAAPAVSTTLTEPPGKSESNSMAKTVVLTDATNKLVNATNGVRTVSVRTFSSVLPGEAILARVKLPDGRIEDARTFLAVLCRANEVGTDSIFSWSFSEPFGAEEAEAAVTQLRQSKLERPMVLIPGELLELFSVTNKVGGVVVGYIEYARSEPEPPRGTTGMDAKAQATIRVRRHTSYYPSLEYSVTLPPGYALRATADGGEAHTMISFSSRSAAYNSTWFRSPFSTAAREPAKSRDSQQSALETQFQQLQAQGPITVALGQPRLVFSVTNSLGEVFRGFFELVGPPVAETRVAPVRPPTNTRLGKVVMLTSATNELIGEVKQLRVVRVHTDSTLFPGETLVSVMKLPDGRMAGTTTSFSIQRRLNDVQTSSYFSWAFPDSFSPEDFEAAADQLRQNKTGRPITVNPDEPFELFSVTNNYGGVLGGYLQFNRVVPENSAGAGEKVHATVRLRPYGFGNLLAFYSADVPPGYSLEATANWAESGDSHASTTIGGPERTSSWMPPQTFGYEQRSGADAQFRQLAENGALQVFLGEPRLVISITNKTGEVFKGFFELVGPLSAGNK